MLGQQGNATTTTTWQDAHSGPRGHQLMTKELAEPSRPCTPMTARTTPAPLLPGRRCCSPYNGWRWYITEWDAETGLCFGLVEGFEVELGYFDLTELAEVTVFGGVPAMERDLYWEPQTLGEIRRQSLHPSAGGGSWSAAAELVAPRYSVSLKFSNTTQYLAPPGMTVPGGTVAAGAGASCPSIALHHPQTFLPERAGSSPQS